MIRHFLGLVLSALFVGSMAVAAEQPRLAPGQHLEGRFVQERLLKGFDAPLRSEGRFSLVQGKGLIWRGERPFETTTVITAGGIVQWVGGTEATRISAARAPFIARFYETLGAALGGDLAALERDFDVKKEAGQDHWRAELAPRPGGAIAQQIEAIIVSGSTFAEEVEVRKPGGDLERLHFADQRVANAPLSPENERLFAAAAQ